MELKVQEGSALLKVDDLGKIIRALHTGKKSIDELADATELDKPLVAIYVMSVPFIKGGNYEVVMSPTKTKPGKAVHKFELDKNELAKYANMLKEAYKEIPQS